MVVIISEANKRGYLVVISGLFWDFGEYSTNLTLSVENSKFAVVSLSDGEKCFRFVFGLDFTISCFYHSFIMK